MSRTPSTPPPLEREDSSQDAFFTTPSINRTFVKSTPNKGSSTGHSNSNKFQNFNNNNNNHVGTTINSSISNNINILSIPNRSNTDNVFFTPETPCLGNGNEEYNLPMSPQTTSKKNTHGMIDIFNNNKKPVNHLRTPETTPRHFNRKRDLIEYETEYHRGINKVANSTIGVGRSPRKNRINSSNLLNNKMNLLDFQSYIKIDMEIDEEDEEEEDEKEEEELARENRLMNYNSSDDEDNSMNTLKRKLIIEEPFTTPPLQIMDDKRIIEQLGNEQLNYEDDEGIEEIRKDLRDVYKNKNRFLAINPFLNQDRKSEKIIEENKSKFKESRFENEIEMVYHATGEKFFVEMDKESKMIKPKKLSFEEETIGEFSGDKEIGLKTPTNNNRHYKMSINGLLNAYEGSYDGIGESDQEEYEDDRSLIKHEKIDNPFIVNRGSNKDQVHMKGMKEIEYINQSSGKRVVEKMDEEQVRIQPRKLDFSGC